ncbi:MAG: hypothetical protein PHE61_06020 [Candidatus Omnitrophica bacterium]|nr:hypothetical protein [Candidatus Omnitrophota bacterium]
MIVEHSNANGIAEIVNLICKDLPVKARNDSILDLRKKGRGCSTWISFSAIKEHPVTKGVNEILFCNAASLDTPYGVLFSSNTSWSDKPKCNLKQDPDEITGPLCGAAAFEWGKGKVVIVSDHNFLSNPNLYWGDHYRFLMNCMEWLGGKRFNVDFLWFCVGVGVLLVIGFASRKFPHLFCISFVTILASVVAVCLIVCIFYVSGPRHYNFFVYTGNDSDTDYMSKGLGGGYFTLYGQWTKEPQLRPWASGVLKKDCNALFLASPRQPFSESQMEIIDSYLARGKNVVYLATAASLKSDAGRQLCQKYGFEVCFEDKLRMKSTKSYNVVGPRELTDGIFRFYVDNVPGITVKGLNVLVYLADGTFSITKSPWDMDKHCYDILSEKRIGKGKVILFTPVEMFNNRAIRILHEDASDVVHQQMAEFLIRLAKYAIGDNSVVEPD